MLFTRGEKNLSELLNFICGLASFNVKVGIGSEIGSSLLLSANCSTISFGSLIFSVESEPDTSIIAIVCPT